MRQFRTTGIFTVIVLLMVAYVYFFEFKGAQKEEERKKQQSQVVKFEPQEVQQFYIQNEETIHLQKTEEGWKMLSPLKDQGNSEVINKSLETLTQEQYDDVAIEGDSVDFSIYGLDKPEGSFKFILPDREVVVSVGSVSGLSGKKYLRLNDENKVYIANHAWKTQLDKGAYEYRNKKLTDFTKDQLEKVEIDIGDDLEFSRKSGQWTMEGVYATESDPAEVERTIDKLRRLTAKAFVAGKKDLGNLKKHRLLKPAVKAKIFLKEQDPFEVWISNEEDKKTYITTTQVDYIYEISEPAVKLVRRNHNEYRNKSIPFQFSTEKVAKIRYLSDLTQFELKKDQGKWLQIPKDESKEVDQSKVNELIERVASLKVSEYLTSAYSNLVENKKANVVFMDEKGNTLLDLSWGNKKGGESFHPVKTNLYKAIIGVDASQIQSLPGQTLLKSKKKEKKQNES